MLSGAYRFPPMESVVYGRLFAEAAKEQVDRSGANAVFLLASGTLNRETDMVQQLRKMDRSVRDVHHIEATLQEQLAQAVANEEYETAAKLRDELRKRNQ